MSIAAITAKEIFLKEAIAFKKEFAVGFVQFFAGSTIDNIKEHAKGAIEGITIPIENELTAIGNQITGSEGLNDFIESLNITLQNAIKKIIEDPNITLLLLGTGYFINKLTDKIEAFLQDQIDMLELWALWIGNLPPPPTPNTPVFVLPTPPGGFFPPPSDFTYPVIIDYPGGDPWLPGGGGGYGWH